MAALSDHERSKLERKCFDKLDVFKRRAEYEEFWRFYDRFQRFKANSSRESAKEHSSHHSGKAVSKLGLPLEYDKSYRINFSLLTPDLLEHSGKGKHSSKHSLGLSAEQFSEVRLVLRHYVNFQQRQQFEKVLKVQRDRESLPIWQYRDRIVEAVRNNQVVIVAGDTGCGKSTQVPQYLVEAGFSRIACTQPRRIACISLAKRVGYETLNQYGSDIAYQVRFETSKSSATRILFLTEGLLLRKMISDPLLENYSVVVVDEVHERHINGDFVLGVLKCLLPQRPDLKIVLMSATINIRLFSSYFSEAPIIQVPGRLYPIQVEYVPPPTAAVIMGKNTSKSRLDPTPYLRILQRIDHKYPATERGDLLIFLSGMSEITSLMEKAKEYAQQSQKWIVLPLHSALSIVEQDRVFDVTPEGVRKCILSTNIAETSITIDGIRFIVDSGKVKEMGYDSQVKMRRLQEFWISKASAEQRKGRAGRTGPGVCFRMYAESDYDAFEAYATPEIHRVPLNSLVLQMASLDLVDPRKFPFIEPPAQDAVESSLSTLKDQGAMTEAEELTSSGRMLARLPVDVVIGKMLIMGTLFHVVEPVLTIAAALSVQSPFTRITLSQGDIAAARRPLESHHGDAFTLLNAFNEWLTDGITAIMNMSKQPEEPWHRVKSEGSSQSYKWCRRRGLEQQRLYEIVKLRQQFLEILQEAGLLPKGYDSRKWDHQSEGMRRELKQLRKQQRVDQRRRKVLKMDDEGGALSDSGDEGTEVSKDVQHLEFQLLHNLRQLQESSAVQKDYTSKDVNLLKIVVCSGLYPQMAAADECNSWKRDSEQVFHTKAKSFVVLHPSSVFATSPEALEPKRSPTNAVQHELLAYVDLLETNKPYLVNNMRVPALPTLLLFAKSIDTNMDCSRMVVDGWLESKFSDTAAAQELLSTAQTLRSALDQLMAGRLQQGNQEEEEGSSSSAKRMERSQMEDLLSRELAGFLNAMVEFSLTRVSSLQLQHLYKGPSPEPEGSAGKSSQEKSSWSNLFPNCGSVPIEHPLKGGWRVTEYLTYNCLLDEDAAAVSTLMSDHLQKVWKCPQCGETFVMTFAEQLVHQTQCSKPSSDEASGTDPQQSQKVEESDATVHRKEYFCPFCNETLVMSATEFLKHKRGHK